MIEELIPADTRDNPLMVQAWVDCLRWASGEKDIIDRFVKDRKPIAIPPPRTPLEIMIDRAAGIDERVGKQFIAWFNENIWGSLDDPTPPVDKRHTK